MCRKPATKPRARIREPTWRGPPGLLSRESSRLFGKVGMRGLCVLWNCRLCKLDSLRHAADLLPRRTDRLADHQILVRARTRAEFLGASIVHFGDVEIPILIHAESVDVPHRAGPLAAAAPRVQIMALQIVLNDLRGLVVRDPQIFIRRQKQNLRSRRLACTELIDELAVLVEHLNAM